jgi:hypothetical protein
VTRSDFSFAEEDTSDDDDNQTAEQNPMLTSLMGSPPKRLNTSGPTMKLTSLVLSALLGITFALQVATKNHVQRISSSRLFTATSDTLEVNDVAVWQMKDLLQVAKRLKEEHGIFIVDKTAQEELMKEAEKLEKASGDASQDIGQLVGDWELICTTASADVESPLKLPQLGGAGIDLTKLPFYNQSPLKNLRSLLNRSVKVEQRIRNTETMDSPTATTSFDRIDHVIEYQPPSKLTEFLDNIPDALQSLNINPLQVSAGKVILVHKAAIESTVPNIKTKLSLSSVIINVAGQSQNLDPKGADVLALNVPLGEFLNAGSFETTYMDDELRISRSKVGLVEQLRIFVRSTPPTMTSSSSSSSVSDMESVPTDVSNNMDVSPSDVEGDL